MHFDVCQCFVGFFAITRLFVESPRHCASHMGKSPTKDIIIESPLGDERSTGRLSVHVFGEFHTGHVQWEIRKFWKLPFRSMPWISVDSPKFELLSTSWRLSMTARSDAAENGDLLMLTLHHCGK